MHYSRVRKALLSGIAAVAVCGAHPASARPHVPAGPAPDSHIRVEACSPTKRISLAAIVGSPTTFTFPVGQQIYRLAMPNELKDGKLGGATFAGTPPSQAKDEPLDNNVPLWPLAAGSFELSIITKTHTGIQTVYPFHLTVIAKPPPNDVKVASVGNAGAGVGVNTDDPVPPQVVFNMICKGAPVALDPPNPAAVKVRRERRQRLDQQAAEDRIRVDAFNGVGGCHYQFQGPLHSPIAPLCPLDNGQWTVMRFPGLSKKPVVHVVDPNDLKSEWLARTHASGDFIVIEQTAPRFRLRLGPNVLDVINRAYNPVGADTGTGTIVPSADREILKASSR